ncbi:DUF4214 domain-containing protein [Iamia sp.]|uniref:DUF4214 domain-containing protein n=1 Tax=Iamia sp. TaxID=2722710 RepID=UPI002C42C828|nr:DUF4214 domain-containing protein [Iamia sp.]HXH57568.1 DUF4214 domain-containing protein [Iamia sp.]
MVAVLALVLAALAACELPLEEPGETSTISRVSSTTADGWRYDFYRNTAYPCSISGYQTFMIATRVASSATDTSPLWVYMHGGGVGFFSPDGEPRPGAMWKVEEDADELRDQLQKGVLLSRVRAEPVGFRLMATSMCNHDIYGGPDIADPNNPNTTPDGETRTVNGLFATKAAVEFTRDLYPTNDYFLHGTSAGSYGSYHVSWALEQQGLPPTGIVADSGVLNQAWQEAHPDEDRCAPTEDARAEIAKRLHPDIIEPDNSPDRLVSDGRLTVPVLQVWSSGDFLGCGLQPMECPLPDGSTRTMGSVDCMNEPLRAAIAAQGEASRSLSMRLCVDRPATPAPCDTHVPTARPLSPNTEPPWPADFTVPIMEWVRDRQADEEPPVPPGPSPEERFVAAAYDDFLDREPTDAERDEAATGLERGTRTRADVVGELALSEEGVGIAVDGLYQASLGRPSDPGGRAFWTERIRSGRATVAEVAAQLYASDEHFGGLGEGDARVWVGALYRQVLDREPDAAGLDHWSPQAARGDRIGVARAIVVDSLESRRRRVTVLYQELLDRSPDAGGLDHWAEGLRQDGDLGVATDLAAGHEYFERAQDRPL